MLAYSEAYEYYSECAKLVPECRNIWKESWKESWKEFLEINREEETEQKPVKPFQHYKTIAMKKLQKIGRAFLELIKEPAQEKKAMWIEKSLALLPLYRIASLVDTAPLLTPELKSFLKKVVLWCPPNRFFPILAPLTIFLLKIAHWNEKTYPQADILFFLDLVTKRLLPGKDYAHRILFWKELWQSKLPPKTGVMLMSLSEKMANALRDMPAKACEYYLLAAFYARESQDFFHSARILHKAIQFCEPHLSIPAVRYFQIESLRLLGMTYEKWAKKEKEQAKNETAAIQYAVQATSAYRDVVNRIWELKDSSWLARFLMEKTLSICETYYLENEVVAEMLNTAKVKLGIKEEDEYEAKVFIMANEEDVGAVEIIEKYVLQERLYPEIRLGFGETVLSEIFTSYRYSVILASMDCTSGKDKLQEVRNLTLFATSPCPGCFIHEIKDHTCFILCDNTPAVVYRLSLEFEEQNVMRSYV
jgi:hypothetical protein